MKLVLSALAGTCLAASLFAAPAGAEPRDGSGYCEDVNKQVTMLYDPAPCNVITRLGQSTCSALDHGSSWSTALTATMQSASADGFNGDLGSIAAHQAVNILCPQYRSAVGATVPPTTNDLLSRADAQSEQSFVQLMRSRDIDDFYAGRDEMVLSGLAVCAVMDENGWSWEQTIVDVMVTDFMPIQQATFLVRGATAVFCPWNHRS